MLQMFLLLVWPLGHEMASLRAQIQRPSSQQCPEDQLSTKVDEVLQHGRIQQETNSDPK